MSESLEINLPHKFNPREYQKALWQEVMFGKRKRFVVVWHRRSGKGKTVWNLMIAKAFSRKGLYYYILPTYDQARKTIWEGMDKGGYKFLDHIPRRGLWNKRDTDMYLELKNGSIIRLLGSDRYDSLMGTNPCLIVFDEFSLHDPGAWDYFRPILTENEGTAIFMFTPRGRNHAWAIYDMAGRNKDWYVELRGVDETKVLTDEEIDQDRMSGMTEEMILQEYYCSFESGQSGAFFAEEVRQARKEGRVVAGGLFDEGLEVNTYWDLGINDSNAIWFTQELRHKGEVRLIDYYENMDRGLSHYAEVLRCKGYKYGRHVAPHDIAVRELTTGKSRREVAYNEYGLRFEVAPRVDKLDSIECGRGILRRCWFDEGKTKKGIDALLNYMKTFDVKNNAYRDKPLRNWATHGADAFQVMALSHDAKIRVMFP